MTAAQIRQQFLDFFQSKQHTIVSSAPIVVKNDPTLLFINSGMAPFKDYFLGNKPAPHKRIADTQKCLRVSGKHNDLEEVGVDTYHHTMFEMLGNWSFGDYFKKEAIAWAWEFLTVEMKLPKEKLWVSVYKDDEEAYGYWLNDIKIPQDRIVKLGDKSNFWPSNARLNGPNGPCGPCSEIFYDYGVNANCPNGAKCDPDCSCGRFSEVWNLVFTQFNRKDGGVLEPLPAKNIDTGMGLERLAAVVQGKKSNYQTDTYEPILNTIKGRMKGISEQEARIIADHMRAIIFGITDGVVPSNEGRGYVMRKLIIILADIAARMNINEPVIFSFVDVVVAQMKFAYPEIEGRAKEIKAMIERLEEQYLKLNNERLPELKAKVAQEKNLEKLAEIGFFYRDTHGLSMNAVLSTMSALSATERTNVEQAIEKKMEEQRERSRASSKMMGDVFVDAGIDLNVPKTKFLGYEQLEAKGKILKVVQDGMKVKVIVDQSPFYAQSGGQTGDAGVLFNDSASVMILDTQKINDIYIHDGVIERGQIKEGDVVELRVDAKRRLAIMRNHSATHLLQSALRQTLGVHVKQQGSLVAPERLRFDFTHPMGVKKEEMAKIEAIVNDYVNRGNAVSVEVLPIEEAKKKGALAFFAEKYGDTVRVVTMGDYSTEFCGGTHVKNTKDIESIKIVSEGSVAQGIRRLEAVTGKTAVDQVLQQQKEQDALRLQAEQAKQAQSQQQNAQFDAIKASMDALIKDAQDIKGVKVVTYIGQDLDIGMLRKLSDIFKKKLASGVFILGYKASADAALVVAATDDLVAKGIKANELLAKAAVIFEGNGGGKPQLAQAGSKNPQKLDAAVAALKELITL